jgi:site-specific recombinase XerC
MLNPQESALIRGFAQGLPLERLATYYLNHERPGKVLRMLNGLRESLRDRAEKHARPDLAEIFGTTVRNWPRHGAAMLAALDQIECLGEPRPTLTDSPQRWLPARLARKLPSAHFPDFDALYQAMERGGHFWWRGIPGLGATKAKAITAWLTARETVLGRQVPKTVQEKPKRPRVPVWARAASTVSTDDRANVLLPLERFVYAAMSQELDGRAGTNRAPSGKMIDAEDDLGAVRAWLALRSEGSHTHRIYRKEAERFLLWAVVERGKALSSLNAEDATAYRDFLSALDPTSNLPWSGALPRAAWLGSRQAARGSPEWRPFAGPLSQRSQAQALTILGSLCEWLVDVGYLLRNPFRGVPSRVATPAGVKIQRAFNTALWRYLLDALDKREPPGERARRAWRRNRFLLYLGYGTGLRLAEITDAKLGDLKCMTGEGLGDSFWVLEVRGKGQRLREVPLVETVARELCAYLAARALPEDLQGIDRELPLIERLREDPFEAPRSGAPKTTLATSSVYRSLKRFFAACATVLEAEGYPHAAVRLRSASTHWLRHTHGTLALKAEIPLTTVRDSLGHANLSTSGIYMHEDLVERKRQMERLFGDPAANSKSASAPAP